MLAARALAHQGGWDEILMVVAPLALFWFLLRLANRRSVVDDATIGEAGRTDTDPTDPATGVDDEPPQQD